MIDITTEQMFPLAELPDHWPLLSGGRKLHRSVGYRYASRGIGPNKVRLETATMGSVLFTSVEALQRFVENLSREGEAAVRPTRMATNRRKRAAVRALDEAGI